MVCSLCARDVERVFFTTRAQGSCLECIREGRAEPANFERSAVEAMENEREQTEREQEDVARDTEETRTKRVEETDTGREADPAEVTDAQRQQSEVNQQQEEEDRGEEG